MTERELAICCAILEQRGLRYRLQPWSRDGQAGVDLWFFTPGGMLIELHAGSMWGFWTFLNLGKYRAVGASKQHQFALMQEELVQRQDEEELEQALWDESHGAGPEDIITGELVTNYGDDAEDLARELGTCPHCHRSTQQVKNGRTPAGSQRYLCRVCRRKYTPDPRSQGYGDALRRQAAQLYGDGMTLRCIARHLGVVHQTVANWVAAQADALPVQPPPPCGAVETAERDDLGQNKTPSTSSRK